MIENVCITSAKCLLILSYSAFCIKIPACLTVEKQRGHMPLNTCGASDSGAVFIRTGVLNALKIKLLSTFPNRFKVCYGELIHVKKNATLLGRP